MEPRHEGTSMDCRPAAEVLNLIGGKWTVLIITRLGAGPMRFSEIKRMIGGITQKMLTATLRDLEMNGLVTRKVTPTVPPRVDYELTELGRDVLKPLEVLIDWAWTNGPRLAQARAAFVAANPDAVLNRPGRIPTHVTATRESVVG